MIDNPMEKVDGLGGKTLMIQFNSVIFATDFSPASTNAGLYASAFSKHFGSSLMVAHGFILSQAALEVETERPDSSQQRIGLNRDLLLTAKALSAGRGATETVLLLGDPRKEIPDLARSRSPSLVVMGTHGGGTLDRLVLGSTAEGILRYSSEPALTVGPKVNALLAGELKIRRILYASDCTAEAAHGALVAVALAGVFSAELNVLNVIRTSDIDDAEHRPRLQENFYGAVGAIMPQNVRQICEPHTFISVGRPHVEILKHIDEREIDLLILGLRKSTHFGSKSKTSGAFPIIVEARCPVLTVAYDMATLPS
jgi:nucleotide-binding universal stress UspA family protein